MSAKDNIRTVHNLEGAWNDNKLDDLEQYFTADYLSHAGIPGMPATLDMFKMAHQMSLGAMPDRKIEIVDTIADGDKVVIRCKMTGTNSGGFPWFGAGANNAPIETEYISIYRLEKGKVAEHWAVLDALSILAQSGAWAPPPMPGA
jgi:predicted ester cyclase